ncbi:MULTISPECIES: hypothetical protein [unclassified Bacillus cereus group]|uniref:hypothetical protein n=1 Tax=unclassified Bacillus cereus group TaxID=2750818 RepID=UPI0011F0512B|nr:MULTISPECIES: hypothetical protein [unclassified Bacillus cereus group]QEL71714.1 hypothetical protein DN399_27115 [Bacillus sp. AR4-2]QEL76992.1 hypothetical protein DN405_27115 [Bacillus sp. SH8-8]
MLNNSKDTIIDLINNIIYNVALYVLVFIICMWFLVCIMRLIFWGAFRVIAVTDNNHSHSLMKLAKGEKITSRKRRSSYRFKAVGKKAKTGTVLDSDLDDDVMDYDSNYSSDSSTSYSYSSYSSSSDSSHSSSCYSNSFSYKNENSSSYDNSSYCSSDENE